MCRRTSDRILADLRSSSETSELFLHCCLDALLLLRGSCSAWGSKAGSVRNYSTKSFGLVRIAEKFGPVGSCRVLP